MSRRDVLGHRSYAPCSEDCAEESFSSFQKPERQREQILPWWLKVLVGIVSFWFAILIAGTLASAVFVQPCEAQQDTIVHSDSSAAVVIVHNYLPMPAQIFLKLNGKYSPSDWWAPPGKHSIFVVSSRILWLVPFIVIAAVPQGTHDIEEFGPVQRIDGIVSVIVLTLGNPPNPPTGT